MYSNNVLKSTRLNVISLQHFRGAKKVTPRGIKNVCCMAGRRRPDIIRSSTCKRSSCEVSIVQLIAQESREISAGFVLCQQVVFSKAGHTCTSIWDTYYIILNDRDHRQTLFPFSSSSIFCSPVL